VDCLGSGSISTYVGQRIIPGTPLEILGVQRDAAVAREAIRKAGRPDMHINDIASPLTCAGKISTFNPDWGMRPGDGLLVSQMVELKTDYDQLSRAARMQSVGLHIVDLMTPLVGGLGGGPAGTVVVTIACHLLGMMCYNASYHIFGHMHLLHSTDTDRMGLWGYAAGGQAISRNSNMLMINAIYTRASLGTPEALWEVSAASIASTVSGLHQGGVGATGGSKEDHTSGLENRFNAMVSRSSLGMTREEANSLVLQILSKYEESHKDPPAGKPFPEIYNTETLEPTDEWLDCFHTVCYGLEAMNFNVQKRWRGSE
jgi:methylamine--corrinoid protein Co-methyltransferase